MKKRKNNSSGAWALRITLSVLLVLVSTILLVSSFKAAPPPVHVNTPSISLGGFSATTSTTSGARIYVTTTTQKIGGIGTGGCSLQEAIYSSVLHNSLDGGAHGVAIDATDPDHFITTECVMGTGNGDTIVLPTRGVFSLDSYLDGDAHNPYGPTATPIIFSTMTIEGSGATLQWTGGSANVRLFAVGPASITINQSPLNTTVSGTGGLTLRNVYIKGFHVKGGDGGGGGGGGGMGAGGAIYVQNGTLVVENSTFDSNSAVGGNGDMSSTGGGGGGGISGNGGQNPDTPSGGGGGGGGGAKGGGGKSTILADGTNGGGGGGTVFSGSDGRSTPDDGGSGGYLCGGGGGGFNSNGHNGGCSGGGGGGGGSKNSCFGNADGGTGGYGGGGGGGGGDGGDGGLGGGWGGGEGGGCGGKGGGGCFGGRC